MDLWRYSRAESDIPTFRDGYTLLTPSYLAKPKPQRALNMDTSYKGFSCEGGDTLTRQDYRRRRVRAHRRACRKRGIQILRDSRLEYGEEPKVYRMYIGPHTRWWKVSMSSPPKRCRTKSQHRSTRRTIWTRWTMSIVSVVTMDPERGQSVRRR